MLAPLSQVQQKTLLGNCLFPEVQRLAPARVYEVMDILMKEKMTWQLLNMLDDKTELKKEVLFFRFFFLLPMKLFDRCN